MFRGSAIHPSRCKSSLINYDYSFQFFTLNYRQKSMAISKIKQSDMHSIIPIRCAL